VRILGQNREFVRPIEEPGRGLLKWLIEVEMEAEFEALGIESD
jgi:hypothetical protein